MSLKEDLKQNSINITNQCYFEKDTLLTASQILFYAHANTDAASEQHARLGIIENLFVLNGKIVKEINKVLNQ